jgi:hypothetical protein
MDIDKYFLTNYHYYYYYYYYYYYCNTPWGRVFLETLTGPQLVSKFPAL